MTVFHGLPQSLQANTSIVPSNEATTASFRTLSNASITYHPFFRHYVTEKASLNELRNKYTNKQELLLNRKQATGLIQ
jgi:hypothetical protein